MNGMFTAAAMMRTTATRVTLAVSAAKTTMTARINPSVMAASLRSLLDRVLQRSIQSCREERGETFLEQARVITVLGLAAGDQLHRVGRRQGVGERAEHEVNAPYQLLARHLRQGALERRLVALHGRAVQMADQGADRFRRLGIGAPEQPDEVAPPTLRVLDHAQPRAYEGANDALRSRRPALRFRLQLVERSDACHVHRVQAPAEYRLDQRVLGAEVVVDRGEVDARLGGEHAHRGALEAVLHEQLLGDVEDPGAGFVLGLDGAQGHDDLCNSNER